MSKDNERTIVHLQLGNVHEYYGSPASLYDKHTVEELGISQGALNNYFCKLPKDVEAIYSNSRCVIRKGFLYVKPTTRGRKKIE